MRLREIKGLHCALCYVQKYHITDLLVSMIQDPGESKILKPAIIDPSGGPPRKAPSQLRGISRSTRSPVHTGP